MRAAVATIIALGVLSFPATAFTPNSEDVDAPGRLTGGDPEPGRKSGKTQDRIEPGAPIGFVLSPEASVPAPAVVPMPLPAQRGTAKHGHAWSDEIDAAIVRHALAAGVPVELARRVVKRESNGNPRAVSKGNYGLMQIRLGTAKAMGYRGNAQGLLDADTNMTYAMKYLSGALRAASGNHDRAVALYARGYYHEAKKMGFSAYEPPRAGGLGAVTATR